LADLTTSAAVKIYGNLPAVPDATLNPLVSAASAQFLTLTRRSTNFLSAQSTSELRDGTGTDSLMLYNYPVVSIDSLLIFGVSVPAATSQVPVGWFCDLNSGLITLGAGGYPNLNGGWGAYSTFPRARGAVTINYHYGYASIPPDVVQAVNEMVLFLYKMRDHLDKDSESLAQQVTRYKKTWPEDILSTIDYYSRKRRVP
jgi:hypothetical protein